MISETLLEFFGHDNWPYLLDPARYGIIGAEITPDPGTIVNSRIVLKTESGNTWSVITTSSTRRGVWEAVRIDESTSKLIGNPKYYELLDLLSIINQTYWKK